LSLDMMRCFEIPEEEGRDFITKWVVGFLLSFLVFPAKEYLLPPFPSLSSFLDGGCDGGQVRPCRASVRTRQAGGSKTLLALCLFCLSFSFSPVIFFHFFFMKGEAGGAPVRFFLLLLLQPASQLAR